MKTWLMAVIPVFLVGASCKKVAPPPPATAADSAAAQVPLGAAAGLVPSGIEAPDSAGPEIPTVLSLPPTTATMADRHKVKLVVVLELDSPETRKEAEGRVHEFQDIILLILADRASNDLLNSFARDDLRFAIFDAIRNTLPPRGLKKIYFTEFVID